MSAARGHDFDALRAALLARCPGILREWFPAGRIAAGRFTIGSVQGEAGDSLSVHLADGAWRDFATGDRGDLIDLYAAARGMSLADAARDLSPLVGNVVALPKNRGKAEFQPIMPVPADAGRPNTSGAEHVADVRDQDGALLYVIARHPATAPGQRKTVRPWSYGTADGRTGWHSKSPPAPRPLYGLPLPAGPVLVVEGEAKRDAAARLLPGHAVVSWPNGAESYGKADWRPLHGREVIVWPDADTPGINAAAGIVNALRGVASSVVALAPPAGVLQGWDLADAEREGWTEQRVRAHIITGATVAPPLPLRAPRESALPADAPFQCLGYDRGKYFLLPAASGQVVALTARDIHSDAALCALATRNWFEAEFPGRESFSARMAADAIIRACEAVGVFDPTRSRGRGAWLDDNRVLLHLGDRILCNGEQFPPARFPSATIYEVARPMCVEMGEPATDREASGLLRLCCELPWRDRDRDGRMLAGWIVAAMVCGVMPWRPHLYVGSETGGGKTWIQREIIARSLGALLLRVKGKTTEAALRQSLGVDARPVAFDESESQNVADAARMQQIMDLARAASSEDDGDVLKGGKDGIVSTYAIRAMFAFSSISPPASQAADEARIIGVELAPHADPERRAAAFGDLEKLHASVFTAGFPGRLLARAISLAPVIRANATTLAAAIARAGASRRAGDTLGAALAGAYSLTSSGTLTAQTADEFLQARDWIVTAATERDADPEWRRAMMALWQAEVRTTGAGGRPVQTTIGGLVHACVTTGEDSTIGHDDAQRALRQGGVAVVGGRLRILYHATHAARAFVGTAWVTGWRATLARAPGVSQNVNTKFISGLQGKSLDIPLSILDDVNG